MVQIVSLPNGDQAQFPDDMSHEKMSEILRKQFPPQSEKIDTILGKMSPQAQNPLQYYKEHPEVVKEMINSGALSLPVGKAIGILSPLKNTFKNSPLFQKSVSALNNPLSGAAIGGALDSDNPLAGALTGGFLGAMPGTFNAIKGLGGTIKNAFNHIPHESIGKAYQSGHDMLEKSAQDIFQNIIKSVKERNIKNVPFDNKIINKISKYLPDTSSSKSLIKNAKTGDYETLRDLQSELFHRGNKAIKSILPSESNKGEEILELRNRINEGIFNHFKKLKHEDLSDSLKDAMKKYKNLQNTYYAKKLPVAVRNMFHPESREIPKNIGKTLNRNSVAINRLHKENPLAHDLVKKSELNENAVNKLKKLGWMSGGLGILGGLASLPSTLHRLFNKD